MAFRAAAIHLDQPDRHTEFLVQAVPEDIADLSEAAAFLALPVPGAGDGVRGAHRPAKGVIDVVLPRRLAADVEEPDLRMVRFLDLVPIHRPPHVGLPPANPNLAQEHVLELDRLPPARDGHGVGLAVGFAGREHHLPAPGLVGLALRGLAEEGDGDRCIRIRIPKHRDRQLLLDDHVVAEDLGRPDLGGGGGEEG